MKRTKKAIQLPPAMPALLFKMIAFVLANQKGGVGKTATARHLIFRGIELRWPTLIVDFDPQGNTTKTVRNLADPDVVAQGGWLTTSMLFSDECNAEPMPVNEYASLIAADDELVDIADHSIDSVVLPRKILQRFGGRYKICIIDTPPSRGKLLYAALAAGDQVIAPCTLDEDATDGLAALFADVGRVRQMGWNPDLNIMGIQINKMVKTSAHDRNALALLRESVGNLVLPDIIYERAATRLAIMRPVWQGNRGENKGAAAVEMKAACNAILALAEQQ
jgi:chromosome partitioning protein